MKLKPIPRSKAKTAYGLLQDVKRAFLEEPKRADMSCYEDRLDPSEGGPACGTVGCFAGWTGLLAGATYQGEATASTLLGPALSYWLPKQGKYLVYAQERRYHLSFGVFNGGGGDRCEDTDPRTYAHARAVVARINRFIKANEPALRKRKLSEGRKALRTAGLL